MTNVVNLAERRPHVSGKAKCLHCKHEWVAVAPEMASPLECPECGLDKGVFSGLASRAELLHYTCGCGSDTFFLSENGPYCANCGEWAPMTIEG